MKYDRYVVAYDIADDKRRSRIAKILKSWGERVNLSVFECEFDKGKLPKLRKQISRHIKKQEDVVIYYPLCLDCLGGVVSDGRDVERQYDKTLLTV